MTNERTSVPIFVIGMHRSGTSMLTHILMKLGIFMGHEQDSNHETRLLITCNEALLREAGAGWDRPLAFREMLADTERKARLTPVLKQHLQGRNMALFLGPRLHERYGSILNLEGKWGAKDPRLTFTLPVWQDIFPDMRVIHIYRHGVDVARSLTVRQQALEERLNSEYGANALQKDRAFKTGMVAHTLRCTELSEAFTLWQEYMEEARRRVASLGDNVLEIQYEMLLKQPEDTIADIARFCEVNYLDSATTGLNPAQAYKYREDSELHAFAMQKSAVLAAFGYK